MNKKVILDTVFVIGLFQTKTHIRSVFSICLHFPFFFFILDLKRSELYVYG